MTTPLSPTVRDARGMTTLLAITGTAAALVGGFVFGVTDSDAMTLGGLAVMTFGGLLLTVATIAWGVRLGVESVDRSVTSDGPDTSAKR